jgi:hypothetical protein
MVYKMFGVLCLVLLVACSQQKPTETQEPTETIVGKWRMVAVLHGAVEDRPEIVDFFADGKMVEQPSTSPGGMLYVPGVTGEWHLDGDTLVIKGGNGGHLAFPDKNHMDLDLAGRGIRFERVQ